LDRIEPDSLNKNLLNVEIRHVI